MLCKVRRIRTYLELCETRYCANMGQCHISRIPSIMPVHAAPLRTQKTGLNRLTGASCSLHPTCQDIYITPSGQYERRYLQLQDLKVGLCQLQLGLCQALHDFLSHDARQAVLRHCQPLCHALLCVPCTYFDSQAQRTVTSCELIRNSSGM